MADVVVDGGGEVGLAEVDGHGVGDGPGEGGCAGPGDGDGDWVCAGDLVVVFGGPVVGGSGLCRGVSGVAIVVW